MLKEYNETKETTVEQVTLRTNSFYGVCFLRGLASEFWGSPKYTGDY